MGGSCGLLMSNQRHSKLVRGGGNGFGFVHARTQASEAGAQSRLTRTQCSSGQLKRLRRTVGVALGLAAHDFAAGDLGAGTQT